MRTAVPVHVSRTLKVGTLRGILRDVDISAAAFADLWNRKP
jgi:predicted RNA binding protein YcfA (HicA-like mRNA interferase family)